MDWRDRARCLDLDPDLFFPIGSSGPAVAQVAEAKAVCRNCPVCSQCLDWALTNYQDSGIWGGTTEDERRTMRRSRTGRHAVTALAS